MTDGASNFPPPGAPPPPEPPPTPAWGQAPGTGQPPPPPPHYPAYQVPRPAPMLLGAAHKPGAFPLRPLTLGAIYDGAFRIIRFNPKATVGAAVLVTAVAMLVPIVLTAALTFSVGLAVDASGELDADASTGEVVALLAAYGSLLLSLLLAQLGITFVTGMIAHVTRAAAVGQKLSLRQAWDATHGKRWRLLGLIVVLNLTMLMLLVVYVLLWVLVVAASSNPWPIVAWGLVSVPGFIALCCWVWIRFYYLPVPPLMLEPVGVLGAVGRGWTLTSRQFWRTFGIALLTVMVSSFAGGLLSTPVSFLSQIGGLATPEYAALFLIVGQSVAIVVQNAFVAPFVSAVTSVQYVDLRMRKEAYDVELMREAGLLPR